MSMRFPDPGTPECWRLDTPAQTLVFASWRKRLPSLVYWGAPLAPDEDLTALAQSQLRPIGNAVLDIVPELSICPEEGRGFQGQPGIRAFDGEGRSLMTQFRLEEVESHADSLRFTARDADCGLTYAATFRPFPDSDVIEAEAVLSSENVVPVRIEWLAAPVLALPDTAPDFIEYAGRWTQEFGERRVAFERGVHMREARRGRTGHDHFPAMIVPQPGCTFDRGEVCGITFAFSGAHRLIVEETPDGRRQCQMGVAEVVTLAKGEAVSSESTYLAFSSGGLNGLAQSFQRHVRNHIVVFPEPARPRLVHYNCWEAVYFDHRLDVLEDLADRAARIGAERFVLDDGWFGSKTRGRDDDTTSLGDWHVDQRKYPDGLTPFIEHVEKLGMRFGLWVEPEMVNLDSDLARAHPDWVILPEGREAMTGRGQHVLDLTNPAVTSHLYERLDALLTEYHIDYLKWDMNRDLTLAVDRDGKPLLRRQVHAVYALIDRLREAHPSVEIESCASGGARIDYGILKRTHRVWLSDSNDAHERWIMQNAAMQFLPPEIVGSHVGPRHCHTSGRELAMAFRAAVAMTGHMGFEMDLRELTPAEEATLAQYTRLYKENRGWMQRGSQHRLQPPRPEILAQLFVSEAKDRFLAFAATMAVPQSETTGPLRLTGLDAAAKYRLRLLNADDVSHRATRWFDSPLVTENGLTLTGGTLMQSGIVLPVAFPDTLWLVEGARES
jgi:alpha-galactosidase